MSKEIKETKSADTKTGIEVILNGGKTEMNSATIPIEWWLSEEVIEKEPKYILIFEQNKEEKERDNGHYEEVRGRRYACKVSDAIKFLQIFSPGYHRIMIAVLTGKYAEQNTKDFLKQSGRDKYDYSLDWMHGSEAFESFTVEEFEVPEQLFAKKPKSKIGKTIWKWTNLWFKEAPRDECEYRKRKIIAFTLQLLIVPLWWLIKYGIGGTFYAAYILLASLVILFVGYRPEPILEEMWNAFIFKRDAEWNVKEFDRWDADPERKRSTYRLWSTKEVKQKDDTYEYKYKYMPITPLHAALILIAIRVLVYFIKVSTTLILAVWLKILGIAVAITIAIFIAYLLVLVYKRNEPARERRKEHALAKAEKRKEYKKELTRKWLLENFELSKRTDEVYLDRLPTPPTLQGKVIQKFRVGFWTLKAKVCKPYPQ